MRKVLSFICISLFMFSCDGVDNAVQDTIKLSDTNAVILSNDGSLSTAEIDIISGNGGYSVRSADETIATARLVGNKIVITYGNGLFDQENVSVVITDKNQKQAVVEVTVNKIIEIDNNTDYSDLQNQVKLTVDEQQQILPVQFCFDGSITYGEDGLLESNGNVNRRMFYFTYDTERIFAYFTKDTQEVKDAVMVLPLYKEGLGKGVLVLHSFEWTGGDNLRDVRVKTCCSFWWKTTDGKRFSGNISYDGLEEFWY